MYCGTFKDDSGRVLVIEKCKDRIFQYRVKVVLSDELKKSLSTHPNFPFEIKKELKALIETNEIKGDHLKIEAGILKLKGLGPTLNLYFNGNDNLSPEIEIGLYDDWEDDLGLPWAFPLSIYRRQPNKSMNRTKYTGDVR